MPQTESFINNRNLFLVVLEPGKSKIKVQADFVCGEAHSAQTAPLATSSHGEGVRDLSGDPL